MQYLLVQNRHQAPHQILIQASRCPSVNSIKFQLCNPATFIKIQSFFAHQTHDWTLIGSGANGLGILECDDDNIDKDNDIVDENDYIILIIIMIMIMIMLTIQELEKTLVLLSSQPQIWSSPQFISSWNSLLLSPFISLISPVSGITLTLRQFDHFFQNTPTCNKNFHLELKNNLMNSVLQGGFFYPFWFFEVICFVCT